MERLMEDSMIYTLIECTFMDDWLEKLEKEEHLGFVSRDLSAENKLMETLPDSGKDLFRSYMTSHQSKENYFRYELCVKCLNIGVRIGMELQKA